MALVNLNTADFLEEGTNITLTKTDNTIVIDAIPSGTASGTDTYSVTINGVTSYSSLSVFIINFTNANTGSSTLNINSLGAKTLKKAVSTNLASGNILAGQCHVLIYDGTNFQVVGL